MESIQALKKALYLNNIVRAINRQIKKSNILIGECRCDKIIVFIIGILTILQEPVMTYEVVVILRAQNCSIEPSLRYCANILNLN